MIQRKRFSQNLFIILISFLLFTCQKDEVTPREYPRVTTHEVSDISSAGAVFHAEITYPGNGPITDHGFVWGTAQGGTLETAEKKSLGPKPGKGTFTTTVTHALEKGAIYYVRAYAANNEYVVYGKEVTFESQGSQGPVIKRIEPITGSWNDTISIIGNNFSFLERKNLVKFDTVKAITVFASDTVIKTVVPFALISTNSKVSVTLAGNNFISSEDFTLLPPVINNIYPDSGTYTTEVTIEGNHFHPDIDILFGDYSAAKVKFVHTKKILATVPSGLPSGSVKVYAVIGDLKGEYKKGFTSLKPVISSLEPMQGTFGDTIVIHGKYFSNNLQANSVKFGDIPALIQNANVNQLIVIVPDELNTSEVPIYVSVLEQTTISNSKFSLLSPKILSFSPKRGTTGTMIKIAGENFSLIKDNINVKFGQQEAIINDITKNFIEVIFPSDINEHEVNVYVEIAGQTGISNEKFTTPWIRKNDFSGDERSGAVGFSIGDKGYVGTGVIDISYNRDQLTNDFWEYEPVTDQWSQKASIPADMRRHAIGFSINGKGYIGGGETDILNYLEDFWEYDPTLNKWSRKANLPTKVRGQIPAFSIKGKGYIMIENELWEYNPEVDQWSKKASLEGEKQSYTIGLTIGDKGYVAGRGKPREEFWEYNPEVDQWSKKANLPDSMPMIYNIAFSINNKGYFGIGDNVRYFWEYDAQKDEWKQLLYFGGLGRHSAIAFSIDKKGYVGTGQAVQGMGRVADIWEFDPTY